MTGKSVFGVGLVTVFAVLLVSLVSCSSTGKSSPASGNGNEVKLPPASQTYSVMGGVTGINMFVAKYDDKLFRGGEPTAKQGFISLKQLGINTIISIVPSKLERTYAPKYDIKLVELEFQKPDGPSKEQLKTFLDTIAKGKSPFYVHCKGGRHKGGILGLAYRLHVQKWPLEKALIEFEQLGGSRTDDDKMIKAVTSYVFK